MLSISEQSNYLARVIRLGIPKKHPNADRLQIWDINGYSVITDMSRKEGDICIYFPIECQIDNEILSNLNLFSDKDLNEDKNVAGYVHKSGRVRAIRLRDVMSEGMILPANEVEYANYIHVGGDDWSKHINEEFDTLNGAVICRKYVPIIKDVKSGTGTGPKKGSRAIDFLIPGQFNFHYSTSKLQDNIHKFDNEEDVIVITDKWHGTSVVLSNLLTKRKLAWWEWVKKFFGFYVPMREYSKMYASRTVLKSIEGKYNNIGGYYETDVYGKVFEEVKEFLFRGYTFYGEIVGYTGEKMIQKNYDYGCQPGHHKFLIYRITETMTNGNVIEYSWDEIVDFCTVHGLLHVPELYYGTIKNWQLQNSEDGKTFLNSLKRTYLEKDCVHCTKKVPAEGICIRNESTENKTIYKLKSKRFLEWETKSLDKGEEVVE